jgi:fatty-acyl-CoA synthase
MPRTKITHLAPVGLVLPRFVVEPIMYHFPDRVGIIDEDKQFTYGDFFERSWRLANGLLSLGIKKYDHIATLTPNVHEGIEAVYATLTLGCVSVPGNTRLSSEELCWQLNDSEAKVLIVDWEYTHLVAPIVNKLQTVKHIIITSGGKKKADLKGIDYEEFLANSSPQYVDLLNMEDEESLASLIYSSGTTARPKGIMHSHRSLIFFMVQALDMVRPSINDVYMMIVPLFHGFSWQAIWNIPRFGGKIVCLRYMDPGYILKQARDNKVTTCCAAPTVINFLRMHPDWEKMTWPKGSHFHLAGSPTPLPVITALEEKGIWYGHMYGMTEAPFATHNDFNYAKKEWQNLSVEERANMMARQGIVTYPGVIKVVKDDGTEVKHDGKDQGEVIVKGAHASHGYWKAPEATAERFINGWFHSGDIAVVHPDHYIEIVDRKKDMILSGGENIASAEVERVLFQHPAIADTTVVGVPHEKWGETVKALVVLRTGCTATEDEILKFCKSNLAGYKCPTSVDFIQELPKTPTGKVQKFLLRERYWEGYGKRVKG